ncbi:Programmed cell death protein 2-like, partial [Linum grandiflorum]
FSWRAFRVQKLDDGKAVPSTTASVSDSKGSSFDDTGDDDDDDEDDDDLDLEALCRAFADAGTGLASNSKTKSRNKQSVAVPSSVPVIPATRLMDNETPVAPCFYLKSQELKSASPVVSLSSNYSSISIKDEDSDNEAWAPEAYEYDPDRTNLKFMKQLDANKNQCFRYSYGGQPLLAAQEVVHVERCKLCGSLRSYEMQLMPPLIHFLLEDDLLRPTLEKWNWLTVLVYTCAKFCQNCSDASSAINGWVVAQEDVFVQSEDPEVISLLSQFE